MATEIIVWLGVTTGGTAFKGPAGGEPLTVTQEGFWALELMGRGTSRAYEAPHTESSR